MFLISDIKAVTGLELLKAINEYNLVQSFLNLKVLLLPVTVYSEEICFSKQKHILRSTLDQEKLSNVVILLLRKEYSKAISFDKAGKVKLVILPQVKFLLDTAL